MRRTWLAATAIVLVARVASAAPSPPELSRCALEVAPGAAAPASLAQLPAESAAGAGVRTRFALIDAAARSAEEAAITAWFPAAWHAEARVDATGMIATLAPSCPASATPRSSRPTRSRSRAPTRACSASRIRPRSPRTTTAATWCSSISAPRTTGAIAFQVAARDHGATRVAITGHFWPIAAGEVEVSPRRVLARYLGAIKQNWEDLSTRFGTFGNHRTLRHPAGENDFRYDAGRTLNLSQGRARCPRRRVRRARGPAE